MSNADVIKYEPVPPIWAKPPGPPRLGPPKAPKPHGSNKILFKVAGVNHSNSLISRPAGIS